jgi:hypothetical protein
MNVAGPSVRFHPEGEDRWIARTANDAYFVVDDRAKEVIEVLATSHSADSAWDTYLGRASALRKVGRDDFEAIAARIACRDAPAQARHMRMRAMARVLSPDTASRLAARVVFLFPSRSTRPAITALAVSFALSLLPAPPVAAGAMAGHAGSVAILLLVLASVFLHELGHAAALRRAGEAPGGVSFGVRYFVYPCFFTDVSSAWLLPRRQRILVNLGGCYLQALFATFLFRSLGHGGPGTVDARVLREKFDIDIASISAAELARLEQRSRFAYKVAYRTPTVILQGQIAMLGDADKIGGVLDQLLLPEASP